MSLHCSLNLSRDDAGLRVKLKSANEILVHSSKVLPYTAISTIRMSEPTHILDPDGEIVLVVTRSSSMIKHNNSNLQSGKGNS